MDDDLIKRARAGEQFAFRQLVEKYGELAQRAAISFLQERGAAEDAVQDAWLDAWRNLDHFEPGRPFRPWLMALVANRCRMRVRRRRFLFAPFAAVEDLISGDSSGDSESALLINYGDQTLQQALKTLNDEQRRLLALRFYADLELTEIAQALNLPLGTVTSRLHPTLKILRGRLEQSRDAVSAAKEVANE